MAIIDPSQAESVSKRGDANLRSKLAWFVGLWLASVLALAVLAVVIRLSLRL